MRTQYKLQCLEWNPRHVKINMFDTTGANCGLLTVASVDIIHFIHNSWKGDISWEGKIPKDFNLRGLRGTAFSHA